MAITPIPFGIAGKVSWPLKLKNGEMINKQTDVKATLYIC